MIYRKLMWTKEIDTSFVGFTEDGAQWLLDNTDIKLVGKKLCPDSAYAIIPIEGLKLDHVKAGIYMLHCLPLRLIGCDGSPIRCILIK
nr:unnamed protein product [Digitaria exilis]